MNDRLHGIFPVLQTPLDAHGAPDSASLDREVRFCIDCGAHGLVYPALGSEVQFLSDRERQELVEAVAGASAGRVPLIVGVSAPSAAIASVHARHAAGVGAAAVMALPPYVSPATPGELHTYYRAIGDASGLPIIVQNAPPGMSPAFLVELLGANDSIRYIKEEANPSAHNLSAVLRAVGNRCDGVFGGAFGRWMLGELGRGASGFMPGAEATDVYVQIWDAYAAGNASGARAIFDRLLPLINQMLLLGLRLNKEVLVRRGVFQSTAMRWTGTTELDDHDRRELDAIMEQLAPLLRVKGH